MHAVMLLGIHTIIVGARINRPDLAKDSSINSTTTPPSAELRIPYTGNTVTLHLDDQLVDLDKPFTVVPDGKQVFSGSVEWNLANMPKDIIRNGDPGLVFPARAELKL